MTRLELDNCSVPSVYISTHIHIYTHTARDYIRCAIGSLSNVRFADTRRSDWSVWVNMKVLSILLVILVTCDQITNGYRILGLFPLPGPSHWVMMQPLMKGLARRGHQVDVVTHFPQKKPIPNYTDINLSGSTYTTQNNLTAKEVNSFSSFSMVHITKIAGSDVCELLGNPIMQNLIKNPPQDPPYDIVITEVWSTRSRLYVLTCVSRDNFLIASRRNA